MNLLQELIRARGVLLADGAWTSELQRRGLDRGAMPEAWNIGHEAVVRDLAAAYAAIPVDVLTTNTFGAHRAQAKEDATEMIVRGIRIAREVAGDAVVVLASLGPVAIPGMDGRARAQAVEAQLDAVHKSGAAACLFETQLDVHDAVASVNAARERGLDAVASFTFFRDHDGALRTRCGSDAAGAAAAVLEAGALAVGANCGDGPEGVCTVIATMAAAHPDAVLWAKPNAGVPRHVGAALAYPITPAQMATAARQLADAGARIVGGCCGCGPAHIAAMAAALRGPTRP